MLSHLSGHEKAALELKRLLFERDLARFGFREIITCNRQTLWTTYMRSFTWPLNRTRWDKLEVNIFENWYLTPYREAAVSGVGYGDFIATMIHLNQVRHRKKHHVKMGKLKRRERRAAAKPRQWL